MFGFMKKYRCEKKVKSHNIPEEKRNNFLMALLTFIMCVIPPFIVAIISYFTGVNESFDNEVYLGISVLWWIMPVLTYPNNGVFYVLVFGALLIMYMNIVVVTIFQSL